jgi:catechol 2,3-dioxygenase-like lactoylglutathione lyase family enzyme
MWTTIAVQDVGASLDWYQSLLGIPPTSPEHEYYAQVVDGDGTILLCLHRWGDHDHPSLSNPERGGHGHGLLLFLRVDDFEATLARARNLTPRLEEEPHLNPGPQAMEFSVLDPDGYFVSISAFARG